MFDSLLVTLGITSPILIALSMIVFYSLKMIFEKKIDIYKETTLEKLKSEMILKNTEFQHSLSIEFDKVRIIHDRQKEVLTIILSELNSIIVEIHDSFNYETCNIPLYSDTKLRRSRKAIYSNGLFVKTDSLKLINSFFGILQNNTDWIFDAVGIDDTMHFNKFDLGLMELILNEVFLRFRLQMGIEEEELKFDYCEEIEILAIAAKNKDLFNAKASKQLFSKDDNIYQILEDLKSSDILKEQIRQSLVSIEKNKKANRFEMDEFDKLKSYAGLLM